MNAQELVKIAHEHGVELHANGDKLSVRWNGQPPTPELVNLLKEHKPELLEWLRTHPPANCSPYAHPAHVTAAGVRVSACPPVDPQQERKAQALFILRECELIEVERCRQNTTRVWVNRLDWQAKCHEYLQWDEQQCQDTILLLVQAQCLEVHVSGRAIRERYQ